MLSDRTGRMPKRKRNSGFSLAELMVVASLITIVSGIAFATLLPYASQYRVKGAAFLIAGELQRARMEAVRSRLCVFFDRTSTTQFRIVRDNSAAPNCTLDAGDATLRTISLTSQFPGVTFSQGTAETDPFGSAITGPSPTSLRFEPRGVVTTAGGSGLFVSGTNYGPMVVTVTAAGAVRTWRREGSSWL
jgi:prepilin-type N-terminal cleavage/methylation domain-containing protein